MLKLEEEIIISTWGIARDQQTIFFPIELQPRRIINCPDTPPRPHRAPNQAVISLKIDLTTDILFKPFCKLLDAFS